jgi:hypothetical protein
MDGEVFYGPWRIEVVVVDPHVVGPQVFWITGSDSADGEHSPQVGQTLNVRGARWRLRIYWHYWPPSPLVSLSRIARSATYDVQGGLRVTLAAKRTPSEGDFTDLILVCRSEDPALDPLPPSGNPYDFSIPKDSIVR